jgi:hypothetical protein
MNGDGQSRKAAQSIKLLIAVQFTPESIATDFVPTAAARLS